MKIPYQIALAAALVWLGNAAAQAEEADAANDEAKVMHFVRTQVPEAVPLLKELKEKKNADEPEAYPDALNAYQDLMNRYEELKNENAPDAEKLIKNKRLEVKAELLAREIKAGGDGKVLDAKRAQLRDMLSEVFDLRIEEAQKELQRLEKEAAELRQNLGKRKQNKAKIVERRMNELTAVEGEEMEWW